jgi:photosystem II stability/assembly factor-like uncharacterized protein
MAEGGRKPHYNAVRHPLQIADPCKIAGPYTRKAAGNAVARHFTRFTGFLLLAASMAALAGCGTAAGTPSASDGISAYSAAPVPGHPLAGRFGSSGTSLWLLSDSGLSTSDDGGLHWSAQALPDGVAAPAIADVSQVPNRRLWIAVPDDSGVHLYSRTAGASNWTSSLLVPTWPAEAGYTGPASGVAITAGPGSLVTVAATIPNGAENAFSSLFTSTDDGDTFVEHPASADSPANVVWKHVVFVSPQSGLVVGGTTGNTLLHTSDGGTTWLTVSATGVPATSSYYLGNPVIVGSDVEVPVISLPSNGGRATLSLLVSHDGGATFEGPTGPALDLGSIVNPAMASLGQATWVAPTTGGQVFETADGGRTWTTVTAAGLPNGVSIITLTGPTSATALIGLSGCPGFVPSCWTSAYVVATTDGGRTWSAA